MTVSDNLCVFCQKNPLIYDPNSLYPDFCSDCRARVVGHLKNRNKKALNKLENKIKRKDW